MLTDDQFASLRRRYRTQKGMRSPLNALWDQIDYFTGPIKDSGSTSQNPQGGTGFNLENRPDVWDFTAIDGREKLSASIFGAAMGSAYRWFFLSHRSPEIMRDQECAAWLSDESEAVWNDIQDSDFNTEMPGSIHELCGLGNAFISMEEVPGHAEDYDTGKKDKEGNAKMDVRETWEGVDFSAVPLRECFFEADRKGGVKTFWRRFGWFPSQVIDFCEEKGIPIPKDILDKLEKSSDVKIEIVFCKFERPDILKKRKLTYPAAPDKRPYGCIWWREDTQERLGDEDGFYERTVYKGVWAKTAGSKWGHGAGNVALPTVKYVNAWKELLRASGEKVVDPSILTTERNLMSDVDLKAAGVTLVRDVEQFKAFESQAKFEVAEGMLEKDQKSIRDIFHVDELQMKDSPAMTATEAQIRYEWMMRLLGKTLAFIQEYLLSPIILDVLAMRIRRKVAKPMPAKMRKAGGLLNIEYQGPLARSQRTDEVAAIERGASFIAGLAQFYPEVRACLDPLQAVKTVFLRLGIPANIMPPDETIRKNMKQILDSMQQQQQASTNADNATAADKHASAQQKAKESGHPLGGTPGPVVYPGLPPKPNLTPAGRPITNGPQA